MRCMYFARSVIADDDAAAAAALTHGHQESERQTIRMYFHAMV